MPTVRVSRVAAVGLAAACLLVLMGCARERSSRVAVYGLAESYVTRPDSGPGFVLDLHEDGTFVLSAAIHGAPGDVSKSAEVARGSWTATAMGVDLVAADWKAVFRSGETAMASPRSADTLATLEWSQGTQSSPVCAVDFVSLPAYRELFHPRAGFGREPSSW